MTDRDVFPYWNGVPLMGRYTSVQLTRGFLHLPVLRTVAASFPLVVMFSISFKGPRRADDCCHASLVRDVEVSHCRCVVMFVLEGGAVIFGSWFAWFIFYSY